MFLLFMRRGGIVDPSSTTYSNDGSAGTDGLGGGGGGGESLHTQKQKQLVLQNADCV